MLLNISKGIKFSEMEKNADWVGGRGRCCKFKIKHNEHMVHKQQELKHGFLGLWGGP